MKTKRHAKIVELIGTNQIETQEELADILNKEGFQVTQATVSRDIKELKLSKVTGEDGRQRYAFMDTSRTAYSEKYIRILREGLVSMDMAANILVIKTMVGMANAVAAALDTFQFEEIVGTLAGDDTIMCATKNADETLIVMNKIKKILD